MGKKIKVFDVVVIILLLVATFSCLIPILNTVAISFSDKTSASLGKVGLLPMGFNTASYEAILKEQQFFRSFMNSLLRVLLGGTINILLCIVMAYPLSKDKSVFRLRNVYMWIIVFTMLFNGGIVPNFLVVTKLNLMDSIWALILPTSVPVFSLIMLMNFYKGIPKALEEAAYVDGANPLYILFKIFVPLAKPAIATIGLFSIVYHWNSFFDGKIYINSPLKMPLQTYIQSLTVKLDSANLSKLPPEELVKQLAKSDLTFNSAKVIVSMIPILLIYPFLQRYFVSGIVMGAVKE